jgi:CRP-like cAMP-binding protein
MAITETRCVAIDAILLHEMQHSAGGSLTLHIYQYLARLLSARLRTADEELAVLKKELKSLM